MKLDEIAQIAGVSRTTASYVINGKSTQHRISAKTQKKVMDVVQRYQYQPNHTASSLRAGNSKTIGLIIPDLENASYAKLAKYLERDTRDAGFQLIISCSEDDPNIEKKTANSFVGRGIDVLIVASCLPVNDEFYPTLKTRGTPIVAIDRRLNADLFPSVVSEDAHGAFELTNSLLSKHPQSIGLIGAVKELSTSIQREEGFLRATHSKLPSANILMSYGEQFSHEEGERLATHWIKNNICPDAIFTTSYILFEGVLDALLANPEFLSSTRLATFGDNRLLDFLPTRVQSLPQQLDVIASKTLHIALNAAAGKQDVGIEVVPRKLVRR